MPTPVTIFDPSIYTATHAALGQPAIYVSGDADLLVGNTFVWDVSASNSGVSSGIYTLDLDTSGTTGTPENFLTKLNGVTVGLTAIEQGSGGSDQFDVFLPDGTYTQQITLDLVANNTYSSDDFQFILVGSGASNITIDNTPASTSIAVTTNPLGIYNAGIYLLTAGNTKNDHLVWGIRPSPSGAYSYSSPQASNSYTFTGLTPGTSYDIVTMLSDGTNMAGPVATLTKSTLAGSNPTNCVMV